MRDENTVAASIKSALLFQADVKTLWPPENAPVLLASLAHCGSVHNRKQFLHIIDQKLVKQSLISFLKDSESSAPSCNSLRKKLTKQIFR